MRQTPRPLPPGFPTARDTCRPIRAAGARALTLGGAFPLRAGTRRHSCPPGHVRCATRRRLAEALRHAGRRRKRHLPAPAGQPARPARAGRPPGPHVHHAAPVPGRRPRAAQLAVRARLRGADTDGDPGGLGRARLGRAPGRTDQGRRTGRRRGKRVLGSPRHRPCTGSDSSTAPLSTRDPARSLRGGRKRVPMLAVDRGLGVFGCRRLAAAGGAAGYGAAGWDPCDGPCGDRGTAIGVGECHADDGSRRLVLGETSPGPVRRSPHGSRSTTRTYWSSTSTQHIGARGLVGGCSSLTSSRRAVEGLPDVPRHESRGAPGTCGPPLGEVGLGALFCERHAGHAQGPSPGAGCTARRRDPCGLFAEDESVVAPQV